MKANQIGTQLRGEKEVLLSDGITYKVFYSVGAMIDLQDRYGSLDAVFKEFEKGEKMNFNVFLDFLYVGIKTKNPDIERDYLKNVIDFFDFGTIAEQIFGGVKAALPPNEALK